MLEQPIFSLVYTSARPHLINDVMKLWDSRAGAASYEWVVVTDREAFKPAEQRPNCLFLAQTEAPFNCVKGWNMAAAHAKGKVLIAVADDFVPPENWSQALLSLAPANWIDGEFVVHVNDGYVRTLCTLVIATRKRYERFGYLLYPGYESLFSDTEFTHVAYRDSVVIEAMHLLFEHQHPDCHKRSRDTVDLEHASSERWRSGETLFDQRRHRGFPIDAGPKADTSANWETRSTAYAVYLQVVSDDFCLYETCHRLHEEGLQDFFFCIPDKHWDGRPVTDAQMQQLATIMERLKQDGCSAKSKVFNVESHYRTGDTRLDTETRVRNASLAWIRSEGFEHILVVDSDEFWRKGTLSVIDEFVCAGHRAISVGMVPVMGLPGYPVERAQDVAVVYIGPGVDLRMCRAPTIHPSHINSPLLFHFTATRRTMDEIIDKHRRSGHYDDPDYRFEEWIAEILPQARPGPGPTWKNGMRGWHMYRPSQIWPALRHWRADELAEIPESLHVYLGTE